MKSLYLALILLSFSLSLQAEEPKKQKRRKKASISVGTAFIYRDSAYKFDERSTFIVIPTLTASYDRFEIKGFNLTSTFIKTRNFSLKLGFEYSPAAFKPLKSSGLEKRDFLIFSGGILNYKTRHLGFQINLHTASSRFLKTSLFVSKFNVLIDERLFVRFGAGALYHNKDYNDFLFGVSDKEAENSSVKAFQLDGTFLPFAQAQFIYNFPSKFSLVFIQKSVFYNFSDISDSPLLDKKSQHTSLLALQYKL